MIGDLVELAGRLARVAIEAATSDQKKMTAVLLAELRSSPPADIAPSYFDAREKALSSRIITPDGTVVDGDPLELAAGHDTPDTDPAPAGETIYDRFADDEQTK